MAPSVLEAYAGKSLHANHGERVVHGCRMMQSASDLLSGPTAAGREYVSSLEENYILRLALAHLELYRARQETREAHLAVSSSRATIASLNARIKALLETNK
jgi:hypothetical protein